jgi:DNA polymerase-3 subunit epsilon
VREVVIDTETTGLNSLEGHRIVEIGCVELRDGGATGVVWHSYFNPERSVPQDAVAVHGLSEAFLQKAPLFKDRASELLDFVGADVLVGHNAALFDLVFLNAELDRCRLPKFTNSIDTLDLARRKLPGRHHTLNALCDHFRVSRAARDKHGALLDAQLLAEVYRHLRATSSAQLTLDLSPQGEAARSADQPLRRPSPLQPRLSSAEAEAHARFIRELGAPSLWDQDRGDRREKPIQSQKR